MAILPASIRPRMVTRSASPCRSETPHPKQLSHCSAAISIALMLALAGCDDDQPKVISASPGTIYAVEAISIERIDTAPVDDALFAALCPDDVDCQVTLVTCPRGEYPGCAVVQWTNVERVP